jgi:hypothetical protein
MSTVGTGCAAVGFSGNQCARMRVPSNDVIVESVATPGTDTATTGPLAGRRQTGVDVDLVVVEALAGAVAFAELEQAASAVISENETMTVVRARRGERSEWGSIESSDHTAR